MKLIEKAEHTWRQREKNRRFFGTLLGHDNDRVSRDNFNDRKAYRDYNRRLREMILADYGIDARPKYVPERHCKLHDATILDVTLDGILVTTGFFVRYNIPIERVVYDSGRKNSVFQDMNRNYVLDEERRKMDRRQRRNNARLSRAKICFITPERSYSGI